MALDLASKASIRGFAARFPARHDRLDVLVNNAGLWPTTRGTTKDNVLFTRALARRLAGSGVTVDAVHPGVVQLPLYELRQRPRPRTRRCSSSSSGRTNHDESLRPGAMTPRRNVSTIAST